MRLVAEVNDQLDADIGLPEITRPINELFQRIRRRAQFKAGRISEAPVVNTNHCRGREGTVVNLKPRIFGPRVSLLDGSA